MLLNNDETYKPSYSKYLVYSQEYKALNVCLLQTEELPRIIVWMAGSKYDIQIRTISAQWVCTVLHVVQPWTKLSIRYLN